MDQITNITTTRTNTLWLENTRSTVITCTMYSKLLQHCSTNLKRATVKSNRKQTTLIHPTTHTNTHTDRNVLMCHTHAECESKLWSRKQIRAPTCCLCLLRVLFFQTFATAATLRPQMCVIYSLFTSGASKWFAQQIKSSVTAIKSQTVSPTAMVSVRNLLDPSSFFQWRETFKTLQAEIVAGSPTRLGTVVTAWPVTFSPEHFEFEVQQIIAWYHLAGQDEEACFHDSL